MFGNLATVAQLFSIGTLILRLDGLIIKSISCNIAHNGKFVSL